VIRFCPTKTGRWNLITVSSNRSELSGEHQGDYITATSSSAKGFWIVDDASAGGRWYQRSNGSHDFIVGTTYYDFLHKPNGKQATTSTITEDIRDVRRAGLNKVRFGLEGPMSVNADPTVKPFFTSGGAVTDTQGERVNPRFFSERVDTAVRTGLAEDVICDLILGFGTQQVKDDYYLKYVMARYGAFPNVWFCIANEWNEVTTATNQKTSGNLMRSYLAYPVPISTHATRGWDSALNGTWHDHTIRQGKLPSHLANLGACADAILSDYNAGGGKPGINDENSYDPNESTEIDTLEGILGSFAGGGYGTTGHKTASKQGGYFWGFHTQGQIWTVHPSLDNLGWMRARIEQYLSFWNLAPKGQPSTSIFSGAPTGFRVLADNGSQFVLASNAADSGITAALPSGSWTVRRLDVVAKSDTALSTSASGSFTFSTPSSRACLTIFVRNNAVPTPTAPDGLTATLATATSIQLTWNDRSSDESLFEIQRRSNGGSWSTLASPAANTTAYLDSGLTPSTTYDYRVRASGDGGTSAWSTVSGATTPATPPPTSVDLKINFQPANAPQVNGYLVDSGEAFANRGNGATYGWNAVNSNTRDRNADSDQRWDTLNHLQKTTGQKWEVALPDGIYRVQVGCGDASYTNQVNSLAIEGVQSADPDGQDNFDQHDVVVEVSDGRLTILPGNGASNAKLCFILITSVSSNG